jgi:hypothetical protein
MPSKRLELYAGKLARTVLRGLGAGNRAWLPIKKIQTIPRKADIGNHQILRLPIVSQRPGGDSHRFPVYGRLM